MNSIGLRYHTVQTCRIHVRKKNQSYSKSDGKMIYIIHNKNRQNQLLKKMTLSETVIVFGNHNVREGMSNNK